MIPAISSTAASGTSSGAIVSCGRDGVASIPALLATEDGQDLGDDVLDLVGVQLWKVVGENIV